jgi:hypothetical protein
VNALGHTGQAKGFSPVWIRIWRSIAARPPFSVLPQILHVTSRLRAGGGMAPKSARGRRCDRVPTKNGCRNTPNVCDMHVHGHHVHARLIRCAGAGAGIEEDTLITSDTNQERREHTCAHAMQKRCNCNRGVTIEFMNVQSVNSYGMRSREALTSLGTTSPRYIRQHAMYLPWRGSHFAIMLAGSNAALQRW